MAQLLIARPTWIKLIFVKIPEFIIIYIFAALSEDGIKVEKIRNIFVTSSLVLYCPYIIPISCQNFSFAVTYSIMFTYVCGSTLSSESELNAAHSFSKKRHNITNFYARHLADTQSLLKKQILLCAWAHASRVSLYNWA